MKPERRLEMATMKAWLLGVLALVLLGAGPAWALDPDTDSLTIKITPSVDFGVDITTGSTLFEGQNISGAVPLALGATGYLTVPADVTVKGNFQNQELEVVAAGLDTWQVDTDEIAKEDKAQVYALFASGRSSAPYEGEFGGYSARHLVTGTAQLAGETNGNETNDVTANSYEIPSTSMTGGSGPALGAGSDMDRLQVGNTRQLYLRIDAPPTSTVSADQQIQVTLTAKSGAGV